MDLSPSKELKDLFRDSTDTLAAAQHDALTAAAQIVATAIERQTAALKTHNELLDQIIERIFPPEGRP